MLLAVSIAQEAFSKLLLIEIVPKKYLHLEQFLKMSSYTKTDKYNGEIGYKIVKPDTTTLYILPDSYKQLYVGLASIVIPIAFVFRWLASTTLLRSSYQRIGKLPISLWIILSLPVILYLVGKIPGYLTGESLQGVDEEYRYFFRLLFRVGNIGGNIVLVWPFL